MCDGKGNSSSTGRWFGRAFRGVCAYPKPNGCADSQPQLFDGQVVRVEKQEEIARDLPD
jgi:hypothetical protein